MNKKPVTDTFAEMKGLIYSLVNKFYRRYRIDRELLVSQAFLGYMMAYDTYDPTVGAFSTWVGYHVDKRMHDELRSILRKRPQTVEPEKIDAVPTNRVWMRDLWISDLSDDARTAVLAVIEPPIDVELILAGMGEKSAGNMRQAVREFLREKGWTDDRIRAAFTEVRNALSQGV